MRELVEEIDSHAEVIKLAMPINLATAEGQMSPSTLLSPDPQMTTGVSPNPLKHTQDLEA